MLSAQTEALSKRRFAAHQPRFLRAAYRKCITAPCLHLRVVLVCTASFACAHQRCAKFDTKAPSGAVQVPSVACAARARLERVGATRGRCLYCLEVQEHVPQLPDYLCLVTLAARAIHSFDGMHFICVV